MSDDQPDLEHEGYGEDHAVPTDLVELHEILEWEAAKAKGPNG